MINENGDLHVTHILDGFDSLYGVSMTFQSLNAALCSLQQKPMEPAHAYYNHMDTDNSHPKGMPWQLLQARGVGENVQGLLLHGALARELPYGGTPEGPAQYYPFGSTEGAVGSGGERCFDTYLIPSIYICQIDTATKAGGTLSPTAAR